MSYIIQNPLGKVPWIKIAVVIGFVVICGKFFPMTRFYDLRLPKEILLRQTKYFQAKTMVVKVLSVTGLFALVLFRRRVPPCPEVIEKDDLEHIRNRVRVLKKQRVRLGWSRKDRNKVFLGWEVFSGDPVYLDGEDLFKGLLILGAPGTGKTQRVYRSMLHQLEMDPKTGSLYFTLKGEDRKGFQEFLEGLAKEHYLIEDVGLLELAEHPTLGFLKDLAASLIAAGIEGCGLATGEKFWAFAAANGLAESLAAIPEEEREITAGLDRMKAIANATGNKTAQSYAESLLPAIDPFKGFTAASLRFNRKEGLVKGPVFIKPGKSIRRIEDGEECVVSGGENGFIAPALTEGFYEVEQGASGGVPWGILQKGCSLLLPPSNNTMAFTFGLNLLKQSFLQWLQRETARSGSGILIGDPAKRNRFVLAQDEGHNFLNLGGMGVSDGKALQEMRQAGLVYILATQSMKALKRGSEEMGLLANLNNLIVFKVAHVEMEAVTRLLGKIKVRHSRVSLSEGRKGQREMGLQTTQAITEQSEKYIEESTWRELPDGVAIVSRSDGKPHLVYCPFYDHIQFRS